MRTIAAILLTLSAAAQAQTALQDRFFDSDGVRLRYVESGSGEPVVLLHRFSVSLDTMWRDTGVIDALARDFRVVALDARGHGRSGKPHDPAQHGVQMAEDVRRLLDHLDIDRAHIVGYSMGGGIAGKFAAMYPERVRTVVFGGSTPRQPNAQGERLAVETAESLERGDGLRPLLLAIAPGMPDAEIEERSRRQLASNDPLALAAVQRGNVQQNVTPEEIGALPVPLLAVVGSKDPVVRRVEAFKRLKPELRVVSIDGAEHIGAEARPEFVRAVRDFLLAHRGK